MKNLISSTVSKYIVNVLMIVMFACLAFTGLTGGEAERYGRGEERESRHERFAEGHAQFNPDELNSANTIPFIENRENKREKEGGETHEAFGIIWLILMALHIIQHWSWYKKLFAKKHILSNKLLFATVVIFILLGLTSLVLLTEIVPRGFINIKEIHEFLGQVMIGFVLIHIIQRIKWYVRNTQKIFGKRELGTVIT